MTQHIIQRYREAGLQFVEDLGNEIKLEMVLIKGGTFIMGTPKTEEGSSDDERPQHEVILSTFFMGKYQVTQAQWKTVAALPKINRDLDPELSHFKGDNRPVGRVSWYDTVEFCKRLSQHTARQYRLPSEAEWEYACRAGTTTPFHFGETIMPELANYNGEYIYGTGGQGAYRGETTEVGSFGVANAFGLYDMHGNVWEWCLDDWHSNYEGAPTDGSAWLDDNSSLYQKTGNALLRGGSWNNNPEFCRSAFRSSIDRVGRGYFSVNVGFRVVCGVGNK